MYRDFARPWLLSSSMWTYTYPPKNEEAPRPNPLPPRENRFKWKPPQQHYEDELEEEAAENTNNAKAETVADDHPEGYVPYFVSEVGDVMMFGKGIDGQLGFKKLQDLSTPRLLQVLSDKGVRRIACGKSHTVCCTESGDTYSWGSSPHLVGRQGSPFVPSLIPALEGVNIRHVACGDNFTVAISDAGKVYTWGSNDFGELGTGLTSQYEAVSMNEMLFPIQIIDVACGPRHAIALSAEGNAYAWGSNEHGALGTSLKADKNATPMLIKALIGKRVHKVACGLHHSAAIAGETLFLWGRSAEGQLALDLYGADVTRPREINLAGRIPIAVACGADHTLILTSAASQCFKKPRSLDSNEAASIELVTKGEGTVMAAGRSKFGQLGLSTERRIIYKFTQVAIDAPITQIYAGYRYSAAVSSSGELYEWGSGTIRSRLERDANVHVPRIQASLLKQVVRYMSASSGHSAILITKQSAVAHDLKPCINNKRYSDVTIFAGKNGSDALLAHKVILAARSAEFKAIIEKEPTIKELHLDDTDPSAVLAMLEYIYTDHVTEMHGDLIDSVDMLATKFKLPRLNGICAAFKSGVNKAKRLYVAPPRLLEDFYAVIGTPFLHDTVFAITEEDGSVHKLYAHKVFLYARAPYFKMMFEAGMNEAAHGAEIEITDCSAAVFRAILEYLYGCGVSLSPDYIMDLFMASHRYRLLACKQLCENFIADQIDEENVVPIIQIAVIYESKLIKNACMAYIKANYVAVMARDDAYDIDEDLFHEIEVMMRSAGRPNYAEKDYSSWGRLLSETKTLDTSDPDYYHYVMRSDEDVDDEDLAEYCSSDAPKDRSLGLGDYL